MELRDIDYFLAVAGERSMRAAAKTLGLTQPALTKAIRRLEDAIGASLFDRGARGVALTAYGETFLRHARTLRAGMREAESELLAVKSGTTGIVRLGTGPRWQQEIVPEAIRRFRSQRPDVRLIVVGGTDDVLKEQLSAGQLDLIVASIPEGTERPELEGEGLIADAYCIVADRDHPLRRRPRPSLRELLDYSWVLPNPKTYLTMRFEVALRAHGLTPPRPVVETDLPRLRLALLRGSELLSVHIVGQLRAFAETEILPLDFPGLAWERASGIVVRRGVEPNPAAQALARIVRELCAVERAALEAERQHLDPAA